MARTLDPEGAHLAAILRAADFREKRVLEVGCGDGRLTRGIASLAASVVAFDPDAEAVEAARAECSEELRDTVCFEVASAREVDVPRHAFDLVLFSWSL